MSIEEANRIIFRHQAFPVIEAKRSKAKTKLEDLQDHREKVIRIVNSFQTAKCVSIGKDLIRYINVEIRKQENIDQERDSK